MTEEFTLASPRTQRIPAYWTCKSICLNFGLAQKYNGKCNLRFDDTNPTKEVEYVDSIRKMFNGLDFSGMTNFMPQTIFNSYMIGLYC